MALWASQEHGHRFSKSRSLLAWRAKGFALMMEEGPAIGNGKSGDPSQPTNGHRVVG
jgi:hypothetical protein